MRIKIKNININTKLDGNTFCLEVIGENRQQANVYKKSVDKQLKHYKFMLD